MRRRLIGICLNTRPKQTKPRIRRNRRPENC
ncbi:unnamed protein product [Medioppia subpectinata]|uniref:Uncharacterized protein n=1 Tax=Medioppia subpectinata TaxID=1979941 RepID=A0A7R9L1T9_9ACAR|nr:unnamed protein product [Medioppia subpectinata]CAG2112742.1 unnamed protein product [Medioppia subpectinata]